MLAPPGLPADQARSRFGNPRIRPERAAPARVRTGRAGPPHPGADPSGSPTISAYSLLASTANSEPAQRGRKSMPTGALGEPAFEDLTARARIRDAALRLFGERGMDGATVRDIAKSAGVSGGLVRHHFGSKDGLRARCDAYALERLLRLKEQAVLEGQMASAGVHGRRAADALLALPLLRALDRRRLASGRGDVRRRWSTSARNGSLATTRACRRSGGVCGVAGGDGGGRALDARAALAGARGRSVEPRGSSEPCQGEAGVLLAAVAEPGTRRRGAHAIEQLQSRLHPPGSPRGAAMSPARRVRSTSRWRTRRADTRLR